MNSQQNDVIYGLMQELEDALDRGLPILSNLAIVKKNIVMDLIDKLYAALPDAIQEAKSLIRRKDELQYEAQQRAEQIVREAQAEADRLLSKSDLLRAVQKQAEEIKEQVISECNEIQRKAMEEANEIRTQAKDDAMRVKDEVSVYAEQILVGLEQNINQLHEMVKDNQIQLEKRRSAEEEYISGSYVNQEREYVQDFQMQR